MPRNNTSSNTIGFAIILAICFIPTPGRAEAVPAIQGQPPPAIGDDPGRGDQFVDCGHDMGPSAERPSGDMARRAAVSQAKRPGAKRGTAVPSYGPAGSTPDSQHQYFFWKVSVVALAGGSALDSTSSWGHREANPLLRGAEERFGARGLGIKSGVVVGLAVMQYFVVKRNPKAAKIFAVVNCGLGATYTGVAVRNWRMEHGIAKRR
ncbi:MAG TPA: hypothetical protein VMY18_02965 [Acidobacteriota bacterium]|nr:hypothetical protein [Acidobacteriota bacterium]